MKKLIGEEAILLTFKQNRQVEPQVETFECIVEDILEYEHTPYAFVFRLKPKDEEQEKELASKFNLDFIAVFDNGKILFSTKDFIDNNEWRVAFVILPTVKDHLIQKESKTMATSSSSSSSSSKSVSKSTTCEKVTETGREVAKIAFGNTILEKGSSEIIKRLPPIIRGYAEDYKPIFELVLSMVLSKGVEMYMHDNEKPKLSWNASKKRPLPEAQQ